MRVNVQLIDAETGSHLWAERFDKPLADLFDMQDEIVARLANALNAQLVAAEARRAEQAPNPNSMDLYFQGLAWLNKGLTPEMLRGRAGFFDRALTADPDNVDALVGSAAADALAGVYFFVTDPMAAFAAAEAKLTKAFPRSRTTQARICNWELSTYGPSARRRASPNVNMRWRWIEISPAHIPLSDMVSFLSVASRKLSLILPRPCASVRAIRWPTPGCFTRAWRSSSRQLRSGGRVVSTVDRGQSKFSTYAFCVRIARSRSSADWTRRASPSKAGLALNPNYTISRDRALWRAVSDDPTYLASLEPIFEGMRKAGVPEQ